MDLSWWPTALGSLPSAFRFFWSPILVLCAVECSALSSAKVMKPLSSSIVWHFSHLFAPFFFAVPFGCDFVPTHPLLCQHLAWLYGSFFISIAFVVRHHFMLLHLNACFTLLMTAFDFGSQAHPIALHLLSEIISGRIGSFIFVHIVLAES